MLGGTTLLDRDWEDLAPQPTLPVVAPSAEDVVVADTDEPDAAAFYVFEQRVVDLDKALRKLANEARQLGSSVGILSASFRLCERLARIMFLFRKNADGLFPKLRVRAKGLELNVDRRWNFKRQKRRRRTENRFLSLVTRLSSFREEPKAKELPGELVLLAKDIAMLLDCFGQFPDFLEEVPEQSLETDLKFWADSLKKFEDDIESPAVRRYIHDLSVCIGRRLEHIKAFIPVFVGVGVKTIRGAQKHSAANLINLSTVATLFSGVTATMIQFSYTDTATATANAVNGFWFTSLVFSISAAVNSLLGLTWMQATFRSPDHRVPWWVMIWIKRSPLVFMVCSVACFFIGLVTFVYASDQNTVVCIVTTVLSISCCFGLTALSLWFAFERWIYDWHDGHKLLSDVLSDAGQDVLGARPVAWSGTQIHRGIRLVSSFLVILGDIPDKITRAMRTETSASLTSTSVEDPEALIEPLETLETLKTTALDDSKSPKELSGKARFIALVERIIVIQRSIPQRPPPRASESRSSKRQITGSSDLGSAISSSRVGALLPKLQNFEVARQMDVHNALVRDIQFSPNGSLLATSSWDKNSLILDIGDLSAPRSLPHPSGFVSQVEWSPNGSLLMTKMNSVLKIWSTDGALQRTIVRKRPIQSIRWIPDGSAFLSVEDSNAVKMNLEGKVLIRYTVDNLELCDVAIRRDHDWMVCVGTCPSESKQSDVHPGMSQIVLYNMKTCIVTRRAPMFHDVSDVVLARDNMSALVSFNGKAPSQLWKIQVKGPIPNIVLRHTYDVRGDFSTLASIFGGEGDRLVMRGGIAGDIHVWDRDSGNLLHHIGVPSGVQVGRLTSLAWNSSMTESFMFAAGSHDGAIRIWTAFPNDAMGREPASPQSSQSSPPPEYTSPKLRSYSNKRLPTFGIGYRSESPTSHLETFDDYFSLQSSQDRPPNSRPHRSQTIT